MSDNSHMVAHYRADGRCELECTHCTEVLLPGLPISMDELVMVMRKFEQKHTDCQPVIYRATAVWTIVRGYIHAQTNKK